MPARLIWSPQARADLLKLYVDIGIEQPVAAEKYYGRIESKANLLIDQPRMGVRRRDLRPSARMLVETPFVILYETHPDTDEGVVQVVEIVRVVNGRQDLPSLF
ncbi:type II toxin-antitoxin system RelE/ParE family toxin [Rhizobium sp. LjRoot254]|uniref:type II toxin-antitoxin system RelE/ParE family toxin n=1 Tax=Rhizobium sp. LjRoot254 TaxID=3342297 RepID=UPI003ED0D152